MDGYFTILQANSSPAGFSTATCILYRRIAEKQKWSAFGEQVDKMILHLHENSSWSDTVESHVQLSLNDLMAVA